MEALLVLLLPSVVVVETTIPVRTEEGMGECKTLDFLGGADVAVVELSSSTT